MNCQEEYDQEVKSYLANRTFQNINNCFTQSQVVHPLFGSSYSCNLLNSRKSSFYKYQYEPSKFVKHLSSIDGTYKEEYLYHLNNIFDLNDSNNLRANVISISLY